MWTRFGFVGLWGYSTKISHKAARAKSKFPHQWAEKSNLEQFRKCGRNIPESARGQKLQRSKLQSGLSSRAKHGGPVFSAVSGSIKDLATVPGSCNHLGPPNLMTFAPAFVFLSVLNVYSFAIEFWGCICYFRSKWISRAKFFTFPGDGRPRRGWIACNMQWLFLLFWMKNLLQNDEVIQNFEVWAGVEKRGQEWKNTFLWHHQPPVMQNFGILLV